MTFFIAVVGFASVIILTIYGLTGIAKTVNSFIKFTKRRVIATRLSEDEQKSSTDQEYQIRFFYDWGCDAPFWCSNDAARSRFDVGPIEPEELGLSVQISIRVRALAKWHDTALNWDYPPHPGPWRQEECDRFNVAVDALLEAIRSELGEEYKIIDRQGRYSEDPDLDRYLTNPKGFRR